MKKIKIFYEPASILMASLVASHSFTGCNSVERRKNTSACHADEGSIYPSYIDNRFNVLNAEVSDTKKAS